MGQRHLHDKGEQIVDERVERLVREDFPGKMGHGFQFVVEIELWQHKKETEGVNAIDGALDGPAIPGLVWHVKQRVNGTAEAQRKEQEGEILEKNRIHIVTRQFRGRRRVEFQPQAPSVAFNSCKDLKKQMKKQKYSDEIIVLEINQKHAKQSQMHQSINQSTEPLCTHSFIQSINQSTVHTFIQSINQSINQSTEQSIKQSIGEEKDARMDKKNPKKTEIPDNELLLVEESTCEFPQLENFPNFNDTRKPRRQGDQQRRLLLNQIQKHDDLTKRAPNDRPPRQSYDRVLFPPKINVILEGQKVKDQMQHRHHDRQGQNVKVRLGENGHDVFQVRFLEAETASTAPWRRQSWRSSGSSPRTGA